MTSVAFATNDRFAQSEAPWPAPLDWSLGAFADGELAACLVTIPFTVWINGAPIPLGGVSAVASLPEQRRRGFTGALLRRALSDMRDRGQPLSGLFTPHVALYVRYGWEPASLNAEHSFNARQPVLREPPPARGRFFRATPDDWPRLDALWRGFIKTQNGLMERTEDWWRAEVFGVRNGLPQRDLITWADDDGALHGWICFRETDLRPIRFGTRLVVRELVYQTPEALRQLVALLLRYDRALEVQLYGPVADPFRQLFADPYVIETRVRERLLLRVVDLPVAVAARPCLAPEPLDVTLQISDAAALWNDGAWRISAESGRMQALRSAGAADLAMSTNVLATLYNGFCTASAAAAAGLVAVNDAAALPRLDALFAVRAPPSTIDGY